MVDYGRGPRGPCGLKSPPVNFGDFPGSSRPARALWIEIYGVSLRLKAFPSRGPRGPCGLKSRRRNTFHHTARRGPRGPCGLKSQSRTPILSSYLCRGPRGPCGLKYKSCHPSQWLPLRRGPRGPCGLKLPVTRAVHAKDESRPARALWIEINFETGARNPSLSRGPRGPCGLKLYTSALTAPAYGRGPRGPCGLK